MAAGVGSKVEYLDYNQIQTIINTVFGVGSGDSGYGQTVTSSQVAQHSIVTVTQWNSLRNDLLKARQHQSGVDESGNLGLPTLDIRLSESDRAAYLSMATLINDNRNITPPSGESSFVTLITANRLSGWTSTVNHTLTIEFGSADNLRWFFNSGGNFQFSSSLTNYQTSGDSALVNSSWETLLRTMGIIKLSNFSTTNTGSGTPATNIGYANLTTSDQLIFTKLVEATLYTPNQYQLYARVAAGSLIITPSWSYTDAGNDGTYRVFEPVTGTLNSFCQMYIATGANVAVAYPQVVFSGSGWTYSSAYAVPPPSYSIRPNVTLVNEGGTVTYTVSTDNIINGTLLSWRNIGTSNADDFTDGVNSGTVQITSNTGTIVRQVRADLTTEFVNETIILQLLTGSTATATDAIFTSSGTWVCPAGVTSVSIVAIGGGSAGGSRPLSGGAAGGAGGGGGGGLAYINNYTVIPGQSYTVVVGRGGSTYTTYQQYLDGVGQGGPTYFAYLGSDVIRATAGIQGQEYNSQGTSTNPAPIGGTWSGIPRTIGYNGGQGGSQSAAGGAGGGGAGSYQNVGGTGLTYSGTGAVPVLGGAGSTTTVGAQGGLAGWAGAPVPDTPALAGAGGGGTGLFGSKDYSVLSAGGSTSTADGGGGGTYGGGGGGHGVGRDSGGGAMAGLGGPGAAGALRIVYGSQRFFPATNVGTSVIEYGVNSIPVATADTVTITDSSQSPVSYSITSNTPSQDEGLPVVFTISTTGVITGTILYWINVGTTSANDFPNSVNDGSVSIIGGTATIGRTATSDSTTEGNETIIIELHSGSVNGPLLATSNVVTVVDTSTTPVLPSYDVAPAVSTVNEGSSLIFYVTTSNVPNGTILYWTIDTNSGDFATINGTITINSNAGQFTVTPRADSTTEGPESFSLSVRTGSIEGQQVAFSGQITIGDTSTTPYVPPVDPPQPQPTLAALATGPFYNFVLPGRNANTKAYYIDVAAAPGGFQQSYSISTSLSLQSGFGSSPSGTFSGGITRALVGFNGPHDAGTVYVTVSAPGYTSYSNSISIPANTTYTPFTVLNGFRQQSTFNADYYPIAQAVVGFYNGNATFYVTHDPGVPRYQTYRAPEYGGVVFWTNYIVTNGLPGGTSSQQFLDAFGSSPETFTGPKTQFQYGTGWDTFSDQP